ncbi:carbohydrate ABC transporter permease [Paenibacillus sp. MWE-103]|uniref:Carbohydrate ABC transporter permease n=1 Tax=Paenibacillus artemisiicola TaxID=1172618 RepID=A0ABS3W3Y6_9BACL|nr:carbohydrate ABC transporter permease [Paenibacillus artemisiicola]MBO7743017.1 carbohydrate ABC transporter permease [Paenibacillus artemisiicola]
MSALKVAQKGALTLILGAVALLMLFPVVLTCADSFMSGMEIGIDYGSVGQTEAGQPGREARFANVKLVPDQASLEHYRKLLIDTPDYLKLFWNSAGLVAPIIAGQTAAAACAAYALAKLRFRGRESLFLAYLLTMLMPFQVTLVPNYIMADQLGLMNSRGAIILPGIFAAFGVFMLRQFMLHIPYAYIEAAKIDGAGHVRIFGSIILPMVKPGIAALVILLFVDYWNMVEQPLVFLQDPFKQPLSVFLAQLSADKGIAFAASVVYMAPMVLLFLYAETYFIEGVQLSGIKG